MIDDVDDDEDDVHQPLRTITVPDFKTYIHKGMVFYTNVSPLDLLSFASIWRY